MSASVCVFVLTCSALSSGFLGVRPSSEPWVKGTISTPCPTNLSGVLGRPTNVRLTSTSMNLVLSWDPPAGACSGLIYTTMVRSSVTENRPGCVNTSALHCDLTAFNISIYGTHIGQVQALWGPSSSDWETSNQIIMDKETIIGPPSVTLLSSGGQLEVVIKDPVFRISSLKQVYHRVIYNITYWKEGQGGTAKNIPQIQQNRVVLDKLDPLTRYCVQVQINTVRNPRPSEPSSIICENTTSEKEAPWVAAVVAFVIMATVVSLVVVVVLKWRDISQFFYPKDALMRHYPESLLKPPNSSSYLAMQSMEPVEEISHRVTVEERGPVEAAESS